MYGCRKRVEPRQRHAIPSSSRLRAEARQQKQRNVKSEFEARNIHPMKTREQQARPNKMQRNATQKQTSARDPPNFLSPLPPPFPPLPPLFIRSPYPLVSTSTLSTTRTPLPLSRAPGTCCGLKFRIWRCSSGSLSSPMKVQLSSPPSSSLLFGSMGAFAGDWEDDCARCWRARIRVFAYSRSR